MTHNNSPSSNPPNSFFPLFLQKSLFSKIVKNKQKFFLRLAKFNWHVKMVICHLASLSLGWLWRRQMFFITANVLAFTRPQGQLLSQLGGSWKCNIFEADKKADKNKNLATMKNNEQAGVLLLFWCVAWIWILWVNIDWS